MRRILYSVVAALIAFFPSCYDEKVDTHLNGRDYRCYFWEENGRLDALRAEDLSKYSEITVGACFTNGSRRIADKTSLSEDEANQVIDNCLRDYSELKTE